MLARWLTAFSFFCTGVLGFPHSGLQLQVQELKVVVDKQPAEVEEKLKTEMDRIMKRNMEVQNENRNMEEQMAEMEKDLVETKMKWAEVRPSFHTIEA